MRLIFAGTPAFAAAALDAIVAAGHDVLLVLTQPDRPAGRGMKLTPSAVKQSALAHGIALHQPERLRDVATHAPIAAACAAGAELMVVAAYGLILPQAVLDLPPRGCINIHASLLPRWRGAAPIQRAIEAGDTQTGITLMRMEAGLDTGPMLLAESLDIAADESAGHLHDRLTALGARLVVRGLADFAALAPVPQPGAGVTYAHKITKAEAVLDWTLPATVLARKVRAFDPFPGAQATLADEPVKVWRATTETISAAPGHILAADAGGIVVACGEDALRILALQRPGSRRVTAGDYLAGHALKTVG